MAEQKTATPPFYKKAAQIGSELLAGIATGITGIPYQALNLAEFVASTPVLKDLPGGMAAQAASKAAEKFVTPEQREYLKTLATPPQTAAGKVGGITGEVLQSFLMPAGKVKYTAKIPKYVVPAAKEAAFAFTQELSKSKDPERAMWAAATAGTVSAGATKVSSQIAKAAERHPYDATIGSVTNPRWWMSEAIKASRSPEAQALKEEVVERLTDVAAKFKQPFNVTGKRKLQEYYNTINDSMQAAIDLTQKYAEDLTRTAGAPASITTPANAMRFISQEISNLKKAYPLSGDEINKAVQTFLNKEPKIASSGLSLPDISNVRKAFAEYVTGHVGTRPTERSSEWIKNIVGNAIYSGAKKAETNAVYTVKQAGSQYAQNTPLQNLQPWNININVDGQVISGIYDDIARMAGDLKELVGIAEIGASRQSTGIRQALRVLSAALPLPTTTDPAAVSKIALAMERTGLGGKPLAEKVTKAALGTKAAAATQAVTRKPPIEEAPDFSLEEPDQSPDFELDENAPTVVKNNNPLALRPSGGEVFQGEEKGGSGGYAKFDKPSDGVRAAVITIQNYQNKYGLDTLRKILHRYAPAEDKNDPDSYANFVAKEAGVSPDDPIDTQDYDLMKKIIRAMATIEVSKKYVGRFEEDIEVGVDRAFGRTSTPPTETKQPDFSISIIGGGQ